MKELVYVLIVMLAAGCGGPRRALVQKEKVPTAYEATVRGDQLRDPGKYRIDRDLLVRYRNAIAANANELLIRTDPGDDLFHVTDVQIESVFLGTPSVIGARVTGTVDPKFEPWRLMHPDGQKAEFTAHYLFDREGAYRGLRNADLVRVWN